MTWVRVFWHRLLATFRGGNGDRDISDELQFHLHMETGENLRKGMNLEQARVEAAQRLGGVTQIQESYYETRGLPIIETLWQDTRFGLRMIGRNPGFALLAILSLTLGIGATSSAFSWIEGILLRPFPMITKQNRMAALTGTDRNGRTEVSWPDFQDLRKNSTLVESFIAEHIGGATLSVGERAERASGSVVSSNYFEALGIHPILGRTFDPSEDIGNNAHPVTVISYQMWKDRYRGDASIVGKTQLLNGIEHTIIGVTPEGFYGTFVGYSFQFWVPASMEDALEGGGYKLDKRDARWIEGFAILKPGVTISQAQGELSAIASRLENDYTATNRGRGFRLYPLWQTPFNGAGTLLPTLRIALMVACLVLLIACANVGNLLLVRSFARRHEMTVRLAVGARRRRVYRQLLTEGLFLSIMGGAGGLLVAYWCRNLITLLFPPTPAGIIVNLPAEIDWRVLALSVAVCVISTVLFGLVPVMQTSKIDLAAAMKSESAGVVGGRGHAWIRSSLVVVQVSLSFVLMVGAGLLLKSLRSISDADLGFSTTDLLVSSIDMISAGYGTQRIKNFQDQLVDRVRSLPGVESVAWSRSVPFSYRVYFSAPIAVDGFDVQPEERPVVEYNEVGPLYFSTMGIPLISGREFRPSDNESGLPVAIVNEAMVQRFWRGLDPVGQRLQVKGRSLQIVGVVKNSKYSALSDSPTPFFYTALRQSQLIGGQTLQIRTQLRPEFIASALAREVKAIDSNLAPGEVITMQEQVDRKSWTPRAAVTLLVIFGSVALLLAGIGLYGVMSYAVSQSTRELGLRVALGAGTPDLLRIVMSYGLSLTLAGVGVGAAVALGLTRLMGDLLYKVSPRDPESFAAAFAVMVVAATAASLLPAWRAMKTDPVRALRGE
jgi:putative ABC transport system permease protein